MDRRRFAVHDLGSSHDLAAEDLADALMPEADAQDGKAIAPELGDRCRADARVLGPAWPGRHEQRSRLERAETSHVDGIIAHHDRLGTQLAEVLHQVVDEAVVVVDDGHSHAHSW